MFAVVGARRVLHEGGMLLANIRVYSTGVGVSCSMDNPWPVHPHPRAVAGLKGPLAGRGPLIEQHREPGEHRRESSVHHRGPEEGPGVQIGDKGSDHPHPGGANPHDSKVLVHAAWESGDPLSPIWTPPSRFPPRSPVQQNHGGASISETEVAGTMRPTRISAGAGGRGGACTLPQSQRITGLRPAGTSAAGAATSASPGGHKVPTCRQPRSCARSCTGPATGAAGRARLPGPGRSYAPSPPASSHTGPPPDAASSSE